MDSPEQADPIVEVDPFIQLMLDAAAIGICLPPTEKTKYTPEEATSLGAAIFNCSGREGAPELLARFHALRRERSGSPSRK